MTQPLSTDELRALLEKAPPVDWQAMFDASGLTVGNAYPKLFAALDSQSRRIAELERVLADLLEVVDAASKRGDFYYERKAARTALQDKSDV